MKPLNIVLFDLNSLANDKILDWSKLKAFADDKINLNKKLKHVLQRVENIEGKGENAGQPAFSPFPAMFPKAFFSRGVKRTTIWNGPISRHLQTAN